MRVEPLVPDVDPSALHRQTPQPNVFSQILDDVGSVLGKAQQSEDLFARGAGDLQSAVYERARADVALSVATAAVQRTTQALQSIFNMQV